MCICAARGLVTYPRAAKSLTLCFGLFPHAWIYGLCQATAGAVTALVTVPISVLHVTSRRRRARPARQSPRDVQDLGPSTGLAAEPQQRRDTEVSHTWSQKSSCSLVSQKYETGGGLCPSADSLKVVLHTN